MTHRQEAARETRRKIIEAGLALVRSGGFGAVSVEAITRAAGVAKGTFYVHFPTKEHLAVEICREPYERLSRDVLASKGPLPRRIARLFLGWAAVADETGVECIRELFRIMLSQAVAADLGLALVERDRSVVESLLRDAVASGELRAETPIQALSETLFAQIRGLATVWCMSPSGRRSLHAAAERFLRNHLPALLAPHLGRPINHERNKHHDHL